jgi:DNA-binding NarL/FixJ family response regulator
LEPLATVDSRETYVSIESDADVSGNPLEFPAGFAVLVGRTTDVASLAARFAACGFPIATESELAVALVVLPASSPPGSGTGRQLTAREMQIAGLVAQGLQNATIARRLEVSHSTVRAHLHNILKKLGLANRSQLAVWTASARSRRTG